MKEHRVFETCLQLLNNKTNILGRSTNLEELYKYLGTTTKDYEDRALVQSLIFCVKEQKAFPLETFCAFLLKNKIDPQDPKLIREMIDETEDPAQRETLYRIITKETQGVLTLGEYRARIGSI